MFSDIAKLRAEAHRKAQRFIQVDEPLEILGWGVSGFVFLSSDLQTAIKVHHGRDAFNTELKAYRILKQHGFTSLFGLTIPVLRNFDLNAGLIQIDVVRPPYLLDFAGVKFKDPQFPPDTQADIHQNIQDRFGRNAHVAYDVYYALRSIGIYYLDLRQSNLNLQGLAGLNLDSEESND